MTTKERVIQLVVSLPDTPEAQLQLHEIEHKLEPNGASDGNGDDTVSHPIEEGPIPTLEESIAILAGVDFPPREEAWR